MIHCPICNKLLCNIKNKKYYECSTLSTHNGVLSQAHYFHFINSSNEISSFAYSFKEGWISSSLNDKKSFLVIWAPKRQNSQVIDIDFIKHPSLLTQETIDLIRFYL